MLLGYGYEVPAIADTGEGAIALAQKHRPDLILMDINLSGKMDGITAGAEIRSRWGFPIIYVTAFATQAIIERAKKTAPSGYILKPYNERQIQTAIEIALYNSALEQQLKEHDVTISTLINATSNPLILIDGQGYIRAVNDALGKTAGKPPEQLIGLPFMSLLTEGCISKRLVEAIQQAQSGKGNSRFEEEHKGVVYDHLVIPIPGSHNSVQSIAVFCNDITPLKDAERQLMAANEELVVERNRLASLTTALDNMDDLVIITNPFGAISYVNKAFETKTGFVLTE